MLDKAEERNSFVDYLKALAIVLVIMNHSLPGSARNNAYFFFIVRMAVPLFVLISGYNFASSLERLGSCRAWYSPKRLARKFASYLMPMFFVFALYVFRLFLVGRLSAVSVVKAFILQSYGLGAYYFWIIAQLYLLFPAVAMPINRYGTGGGGY